MLSKRIIPCLDIKDGRVVKGIRFNELRDAGDVVALAHRYYEEGADEIAMLDITATVENRRTVAALIKEAAKSVFVPILAGGGVRTLSDFEMLLEAGADKVSINTAAVREPKILSDAAKLFGSQSVVLACDTRRKADGGYTVLVEGGKTDTGLELFAWLKESIERGAGEILLTSWDLDGTQQGYDISLLKRVSERFPVPLIASGGAGTAEDIAAAFLEGKVDAALAASIFHFRKYTVKEVKQFLKNKGLEVRL
ncbi:MAG: imidazole glycerol phosphate synthase subunit HisF [Planctomycetota bacterium]|nr:imidazole glycerol phosphate synthase subunit HisF [Planctomycetota bacterium]